MRFPRFGGRRISFVVLRIVAAWGMLMVEFVVVGHVTRDVAIATAMLRRRHGDSATAEPEGWRLGGTVTFAAVQAHRLGMGVGVVTSASDEVMVRLREALPFAEVRGRSSSGRSRWRLRT